MEDEDKNSSNRSKSHQSNALADPVITSLSNNQTRLPTNIARGKVTKFSCQRIIQIIPLKKDKVSSFSTGLPNHNPYITHTHYKLF